MSSVPLCNIAELDDPGAKSFTIGEGLWPAAIFVIRQGEQVWGYVNQCPHAGHQLNWVGDRFLNRERDHILCASHGALFEIETGLCVGGPCPGERLQTVPLELEGGEIGLTAATLRVLETRKTT